MNEFTVSIVETTEDLYYTRTNVKIILHDDKVISPLEEVAYKILEFPPVDDYTCDVYLVAGTGELVDINSFHIVDIMNDIEVIKLLETKEEIESFIKL